MPTASHASQARPGASHPDFVMRVQAAGTRVRQLLQKGVRARAMANAMGWSRQDVATTRQAMDQLRTWLERNPQPGINAMRALITEHGYTLRIAIPANAAGKRLLASIEETIKSITP